MHVSSVAISITIACTILTRVLSFNKGGVLSHRGYHNPHRHTATFVSLARMKRSSENTAESGSPAKRLVSSAATAAANATAVKALPLPFNPPFFNAKRARMISEYNTLPSEGECVVYWMSRDQRAEG